MNAIETLLPEIERAVVDRVESKALASMGAGELRDLIYKIVERHRLLSLSPAAHFAELIQVVAERHGDLVKAKDYSIEIRELILRHLLYDVLPPALPSLLGSIVVETWKRPEEHVTRSHHAFLQGFELLNGKKEGPVAPDVVATTGRSWWVVGLPPENAGDAIHARYAMGAHAGRTDDKGVGVTSLSLELVSCAEAAAQIRDTQLQEILEALHGRVLSLTGSKVVDTTDDLWRVAGILESALCAMKDLEADSVAAAP